MSAKQILPAPVPANDSVNPVGHLRRAENKGGNRQKAADNRQQNSVPGSSEGAAWESAEYIAVLASQLQRIAETNGHQFLAYLIDMAVMEAWRIAGPDADRPDKSIKSAGDGQV